MNQEKVKKEVPEVLIDVCIPTDDIKTAQGLFDNVLLKLQMGEAPLNWHLILHYEPQAIIQPAITKSHGPVFARHIKTPDLVILWLYEAPPKSAGTCSTILKCIRDSLGIPVIVIKPPSKKEDDGEIDSINVNPISWVLHRPIDPGKLVKIIKLLLARRERDITTTKKERLKECWDQPKSDAEIEAELIRQGWRKEIRGGCEVLVRSMEEEK